MLINVKINNYKGIEKEALVSAIASNKIKRSINSVSYINDKTKILKTIGIIGCNASGKTSFLDAVETVQNFIVFPFRKDFRKSEELINNIKKMKEEEIREFLVKLNTLSLGEANINQNSKNTEIEIEIFAPRRKNNISGFYKYKITYDKNYQKNGVTEELKYKVNYNDKYATLFRKQNILESHLGTTILYENNNIKISDKKYINNYKSFMLEMIEHTNIIFNGASVDLHNALDNNKDAFIKLCNIADDKIINVTVDENSLDRNILFWNKSGNYLYFSQLSAGTTKTIVLGSILLNSLKNNDVTLIDEIELSLHPRLVEFLVSLIVSKRGKNYAQIIFTTHSPLIAFSLKNDELYFIYNHNKDYFFSSISNAIKLKLITKDQNLEKAWINDLLIKNPDQNKIYKFLNSLNNDK